MMGTYDGPVGAQANLGDWRGLLEPSRYNDPELDVEEALGEFADDFDIPAIVDETVRDGNGAIRAFLHGQGVDIDDDGGMTATNGIGWDRLKEAFDYWYYDYFWETVQRHDITGKVKNWAGNLIDYAAAVNLMDDDLREEISMRLAPCTNQKFIDEYAARHKERFGEPFAPYTGGNW